MSQLTDPIDGSVTIWLQSLRRGDDAAARQVWDRYFARVVALARRKFGTRPRRVSDEEDVAISVLATLVRRAKEGRFPDLNDQRALWCLLVAITQRKVAGVLRKEGRGKRGGGKVRGDSVLAKAGGGDRPFSWDDFAADDPTPDFLTAIDEQYRQLYAALRDDSLRNVVDALMEGYTISEIAARLNVSKRTIQRKVNLIRDNWSRVLVQ